MIITMMIQGRAEREGHSIVKTISEFKKLRTYAQLFDKTTGLWKNGSDYISDEYDLELQRKQ